LTECGFAAQLELDPWDPSPGGHFVQRDGAIIAYRLPAKRVAEPRFRIIGTHTDSAGFKLKPNPQHYSAGWAQAGMEVYGSPAVHSWVDREFGLAGRVVSKTGEQRLISTEAWLRIPGLAPHLDPDLSLDRQRHLMPIYALADSLPLMQALAEGADLTPEDIVGHDLFAYITQPPELIGLDKTWLASGRLDNLVSVYTGMQALMEADPELGAIPVLACLDHEEVGSGSLSGAGGPFLEQVLARIELGLGLARDQVYRLRARSAAVSVDAGHAVHPNFADRHDPDARPLLGGGPMVKVNAGQRYVTDGVGVARWQGICDSLEVPVQTFVSNNAVSCGSTIGPLLAARLGIATLDVGIPVLSMHSARELCATADVDHLATALTGFLAQ
jgi:aspartyl aminopeptidase